MASSPQPRSRKPNEDWTSDHGKTLHQKDIATLQAWLMEDEPYVKGAHQLNRRPASPGARKKEVSDGCSRH
jgi:hypothetical protein